MVVIMVVVIQKHCLNAYARFFKVFSSLFFFTNPCCVSTQGAELQMQLKILLHFFLGITCLDDTGTQYLIW